MSAVLSSHRRFLSVPDTFKECVSSRQAKADGGRELETTLKYFTNKIEEVELSVVDSSHIVDFLITENEENFADNYYSDTKTKLLRTAVVRCNFADSETLMRSVKANCDKHNVNRVVISSHAASVQGAIEQLVERNRHVIIVIEQLESMEVNLFNRLIASLAFYNELDVSVLICISTSRSVFYAHCSMENFEELHLKYFEMPSPQEQFEKLANVLSRRDDEKSPTIFLSGELLNFLRNRFLRGDFSMAELKKIVRLSIVDNFMRYDVFLGKEEDDDFPERLPLYWCWFDVLVELFREAYEELRENENPPVDIELHADVQRDASLFWKESKAVETLTTWLVAKSQSELCVCLERIAEAVMSSTIDDSEKLRQMAERLREEVTAGAGARLTQAPTTPSGGPARKMTTAELLQANRARQVMAAGSRSLMREAVGTLIGIIRERLFEWRPYDDYLLMVPEGIRVPDLSQKLVMQSNKPLSFAYGALAGIDQFKAVSMARWGHVVSDRMDNAEFYDCVAQLERMGVIKDVSKPGKRKQVLLQMKPMIDFN